MKCRHCRKKTISRPRNLCWRCYYTPEIKRLHDSKSIIGSGTKNFYSQEPVEPTNHQPGSEQKILVLCERASKNQPLFHPGDSASNTLVILNLVRVPKVYHYIHEGKRQTEYE